MLYQISKKLSEHNLSLAKDRIVYNFKLSDTSTEDATQAIIKMLAIKDATTSEFELCRIPVPISDNLFSNDGTLYRLVNALSLKDGFYISKRRDASVLQFSSRDRLLFQISVEKHEKSVDIMLKKSSRPSDTTAYAIPIFDMLVVLGCIDKKEDFNLLFEDMLDRIYTDSENCADIKIKQDKAYDLLKNLFRASSSDPVKELNHRVFDNFFDTMTPWENKDVFFSFARFVNCTLKGINGKECKQKIITPMMARSMDLDKNIKSITLDINGDEVNYTPDRGNKFTQDTLINVLKLFCIVNKYNLHECDKNAIWNLTTFTYYDYIVEYIEASLQQYVNSNGAMQPKPLDGFYRFIKKNLPKAEETVSVPNPISYEALRYTFAKDIFKNTESFVDRDKLIHKSHIGWISPSVSSDSKKIGLTGCFDANAIRNDKLCREFIDISNSEPDGTGKDTKRLFEPWQTYNKIICIKDSEKGTYDNLLNGELTDKKLQPDLLIESKDIYDVLTGNIVGKNSNQAKRDILGYKAINQSMPAICPDLVPLPRLKNSLENKSHGKTMRQILDEISNRSLKGDRIYTENSVISIKEFHKDTTQNNLDLNSLTMKIIVDNVQYEYKTLKFINSATQNVKLQFLLQPPSEGEYYKLDDVVISCGDYRKVGQEINIMFGNFEGSTYEDAVCITSNFMNRMNFANKLYFHMDLDVSNEGARLVETYSPLPYLDSFGLPTIGTFISKGQVIARVGYNTKGKATERNEKTAYKKLVSTKAGYVQSIRFFPNRENVSKIRIMICDLRKLTKGDKTGNGHGNKGVIMKIINSDDICVNGSEVDMIINPLGTIGRMNIGQLKEMLSTAICDSENMSLSFRDIGTENLTIEELTNKLKEKGNYEEHNVIYKSELLHSKFFISKMRVYRTEHISSSKLNYTERDSLNMNGVVSNGQRMSELASLVYNAYGAEEILRYLTLFQSRTKSNYLAISKSIEKDEPLNYSLDDTKFEDMATYRINALFNGVGMKLTKNGIELLTNNDIANLFILSTVGGDDRTALHKEELNGMYDIDSVEGYKLMCKISKPNGIIMPPILRQLFKILPTYMRKYKESLSGDMTTSLEKVTISDNITYNSTGFVARRSPIFFKLSERAPSKEGELPTKIIIVEPQGKMALEEFVKSKGTDSYGWGNKYEHLVSMIKQLDLNEVIENMSTLNNTGKQLCKALANAYTTERERAEFFSSIVLDGIPILPINLRPQFDGTNSATEYDSIYSQLNSTSSDLYYHLNRLSSEIDAVLTQHQGVKENKTLGTVSHDEKKTELRDNMFARNYSNSGRSVAGYDFNLGIDELSIPKELAIGMVREMLVSRVLQELLNIKSDRPILPDEFKEILNTNDNGAIKKFIHKTINDMLSGVSYNKDVAKIIDDKLSEMYNKMAVIMTREPILQRQNEYAYHVKFNDGDCIEANPSVCKSYNLDFDGDQEGIQVILSHAMSVVAFNKMTPYNGMFDISGKDSPFRPFQDILFSLYRMTKDAPSDNLRGIYTIEHSDKPTTLYRAFPDELRDVISDWNSGVIKLSDTIIINNISTNSHLRNTVGTILFVAMMLGSKFMEKEAYVAELISYAKGGVTNKTCSTLVTLIDKFAKEESQKYMSAMNGNDMLRFSAENYGYSSTEDIERFYSNSYYELDANRSHVLKVYTALERMNRGALWIYTIQGVSLSPEDLSIVKTVDTKAEEKKTNDKMQKQDRILDLFLNSVRETNSEVLFSSLKNISIPENVEHEVRESLYKNQFFNDLIKSGARGKEQDFMQMYGIIGSISYQQSTMFINGNYNKGVSILDKYRLSMPVRMSHVNTQNHLGVDGESLRKTCVLASKLQYSKVDNCGCKPMEYSIEYDYFLDGKKFEVIDAIDLAGEKHLLNKISVLIKQPLDGDKFGTKYSPKFVANLLNSCEGKEKFLNSGKLTCKLSKFSKDFISEHNIVLEGKKVSGAKALDDIEKTGVKTVLMYNVYTCKASDGICQECYGILKDQLKHIDFKGNLGINTIFAIGQEKVQSTLDSAKDSKKKKEVKHSAFDLMQASRIKNMSMPLRVFDETFEIESTKVKIVTIERESFDSFTVKGKVDDKDVSYLYSGDELDLDYLRHNFFIPKLLNNYVPCLGDNKSLERIYVNYLKALNDSCGIKASEIILGINTRYYVKPDDIQELKEESDELTAEEQVFIPNTVIKMDENFTPKFFRYWYNNTQVVDTEDLVAHMCLPKSSNTLFVDAFRKRDYGKANVFAGRFSFEKLKPTLHFTTGMNWLDNCDTPKTNIEEELSESKQFLDWENTLDNIDNEEPEETSVEYNSIECSDEFQDIIRKVYKSDEKDEEEKVLQFVEESSKF